MDHPATDQPANFIRGNVVAGVDRDDARRVLRRGRIDLVDRCVRMRRAQKMRLSLARTIDVVDVAALAGDEAVVFLALDGGANAGRTH
jgi:hypothetical protein